MRTAVILLSGSLDASSAPLLQQEAEKCFRKPEMMDVLIDMGGVDYISSMGLGTLIALMKIAKSNRATLTLYDSQASVERMMQMTKIDFLMLNPKHLDVSNPFVDYVKTQEKMKEDEKLRAQGKPVRGWPKPRAMSPKEQSLRDRKSFRGKRPPAD